MPGNLEGEDSKAESSPSKSKSTANLTSNVPKRPLIEEISSEPPKLPLTTENRPKSILKKPGGSRGGSASLTARPESVVQSKTYGEESGLPQANEGHSTYAEESATEADPHVMTLEDARKEVPHWRWEGRTMVVDVPKFVSSFFFHNPSPSEYATTYVSYT